MSAFANLKVMHSVSTLFIFNVKSSERAFIACLYHFGTRPYSWGDSIYGTWHCELITFYSTIISVSAASKIVCCSYRLSIIAAMRQITTSYKYLSLTLEGPVEQKQHADIQPSHKMKDTSAMNTTPWQMAQCIDSGSIYRIKSSCYQDPNVSSLHTLASSPCGGRTFSSVIYTTYHIVQSR
jgi:hypothetical protein